MWIFTINGQISGMTSTEIYRVNGNSWGTVGPKLYRALKALGPHDKVGSVVSKLTYEEFEQNIESDGSGMFSGFEVRSVHPNDDHWVA